jgi:hypothetical protein
VSHKQADSPLGRPSFLLKLVTLHPVCSGRLYHLTLLTGPGDLLALVIGFRRWLSICRNVAVVHTANKVEYWLH